MENNNKSTLNGKENVKMVPIEDIFPWDETGRTVEIRTLDEKPED